MSVPRSPKIEGQEALSDEKEFRAATNCNRLPHRRPKSKVTHRYGLSVYYRHPDIKTSKNMAPPGAPALLGLGDCDTRVSQPKCKVRLGNHPSAQYHPQP